MSQLKAAPKSAAFFICWCQITILANIIAIDQAHAEMMFNMSIRHTVRRHTKGHCIGLSIGRKFFKIRAIFKRINTE